jgi:hypothetical protein
MYLEHRITESVSSLMLPMQGKPMAQAVGALTTGDKSPMLARAQAQAAQCHFRARGVFHGLDVRRLDLSVPVAGALGLFFVSGYMSHFHLRLLGGCLFLPTYILSVATKKT